MSEFLTFFDEKVKSFPMHLDIYYSKIMSWVITVTKKDCASDYPDSPHDGNDVIIVEVNEPDMSLAFAKAQVELKEWLLEYEGGY